MNLALNHTDIVAAVEDFVVNQGIKVTGKGMVISFTCGRGANAMSASVELVDADSLAAGPEKGAVVPGNGLDHSDDAGIGIAGEELPPEEVEAAAGESSTGGLFDE